jgi:hypothetical protein
MENTRERSILTPAEAALNNMYLTVLGLLREEQLHPPLDPRVVLSTPPVGVLSQTVETAYRMGIRETDLEGAIQRAEADYRAASLQQTKFEF